MFCSATYRSILSVLGLMAIALTIGCGDTTVQDDRPERAKVSGKITLDGAPVEGATIRLEAKTGSQQGAIGVSEADGTFVLTTYSSGDGVLPGTYMVIATKTKIEGMLSDEEANEYNGRGEEIPEPTKTELLPAKYATAKTTDIEISVALGEENTLNLDLKK